MPRIILRNSRRGLPHEKVRLDEGSNVILQPTLKLNVNVLAVTRCGNAFEQHDRIDKLAQLGVEPYD